MTATQLIKPSASRGKRAVSQSLATTVKKQLLEDKPKNYWYGLGRRKMSVATVKVYEEKGPVTVSGKPHTEYFQQNLHDVVTAPLKILGLLTNHRVEARVTGGGIRGQAEAVRLGIARALLVKNPDWKKTLRSNGLVTRDPRAKERKKYGLKRARRAPQWTKR